MKSIGEWLLRLVIVCLFVAGIWWMCGKGSPERQLESFAKVSLFITFWQTGKRRE